MPNLREIEKQEGGIIKKFKLQTSISASNKVLFDENQHIHKYASEGDIMKQWYGLREDLYVKRKAHQLAKLKKEYEVIRNKVRFIKGILDESVKLKGTKRTKIVMNLKA